MGWKFAKSPNNFFNPKILKFPPKIALKIPQKFSHSFETSNKTLTLTKFYSPKISLYFLGISKQNPNPLSWHTYTH